MTGAGTWLAAWPGVGVEVGEAGRVIEATFWAGGWPRRSLPMLPSKVNWGAVLLALGSTCRALA